MPLTRLGRQNGSISSRWIILLSVAVLLLLWCFKSISIIANNHDYLGLDESNNVSMMLLANSNPLGRVERITPATAIQCHIMPKPLCARRVRMWMRSNTVLGYEIACRRKRSCLVAVDGFGEPIALFAVVIAVFLVAISFSFESEDALSSGCRHCFGQTWRNFCAFRWKPCWLREWWAMRCT